MMYQYHTNIDFNEVDIRVYQPEKSDIHRGRGVNKSLCQPKFKSVSVLLYDFVFDFLCKISTFTFAINNTEMND